MRRSYLIQRLTKPRRAANVFAFGGGLRNGGLSDDAMSLLSSVFAFDYMGAAEFEFGAVPKALQGLASEKTKRLTAFSFDISLADVEPDFRDKAAAEGVDTVYVLSRRSDAEEVEARIRSWAEQRFNPNLKEPTRLASALRPFHEFDGEVTGWLELDNGFFFFTDRQMWEQTCALFGVKAVNP